MPLDFPNPDNPVAHLRNLEESLLDPAVRRDRKQVEALLAEDFQELGSSGRVWSRGEILDLLGSEDFQPITVEEFSCHPIKDGIALVTYRAVRTDEGRGKTFSTLRSSLWVQESGQWRMRFHQGTRVATPAGE